MWLKQLINWTSTGLVGVKRYTQPEMLNLIETDGKAKEVVPEYAQILELFKKAKDKDEIGKELRGLE